ncbi:MAG: hypothetical protein AMXMBFR64_39360 [Myxococcales bacterium]
MVDADPREGTAVDDDKKRSIEVITVDDAANVLGVSRRQVYRLVEAKAVPHLRLGGCVRFERGLLEAWIKSEMMKGVQADGGTTARDDVGGGLLYRSPEREARAVPPVAWGGRHIKEAGREGRGTPEG